MLVEVDLSRMLSTNSDTDVIDNCVPPSPATLNGATLIGVYAM